MATLIINIPDSVAADVNNTLADYFSYQDTIDGLSNPQTKAQFNKANIAAYLKRLYISHKTSMAAGIAKQTEEDSLKGVAIV